MIELTTILYLQNAHHFEFRHQVANIFHVPTQTTSKGRQCEFGFHFYQRRRSTRNNIRSYRFYTPHKRLTNILRICEICRRGNMFTLRPQYVDDPPATTAHYKQQQPKSRSGRRPTKWNTVTTRRRSYAFASREHRQTSRR